MGKKKPSGYNDFLDGEKLTDNNEIRTTLQSSASLTRDQPPPQGMPRGNRRVTAAPKKPPLTHFLCLPLVTEANKSQLQRGLEQLRHELEDGNIAPSKAVRPVGTLHLTLGVMSLDADRLAAATQHLEELDLAQILRGITTRTVAEAAAESGLVSENLNAAAPPNTAAFAAPDPSALNVDLQALIPMHAARSTSILYAEPRDPNHRLMPFAKALRDSFVEHGFLVEDTRPLKLHATVVNTIYAKPRSADRSRGHGPNASSWMRFDATDLVQRYQDYTWAEVRVDRVQICQMGAQKVVGDGGEVLDEKYVAVCEKRIRND
jgi:activating signal cointegrator complex subunit 1